MLGIPVISPSSNNPAVVPLMNPSKADPKVLSFHAVLFKYFNCCPLLLSCKAYDLQSITTSF